MNKVRIVGTMVVVGGLILSAGCGTTRPPVSEPEPQVVMPPLEPVKEPVVMEVKTPVAEVQTKTYVVKSGDSIGMIAKRFKVPSKDVMKLNKITNANKIRIGQKLTLPGYVDLNAPAPARPKVKKAKPVVLSGDTYVVKSGDMLGSIAIAHNTTIKAIKAANGLTSDRLQVGQKLAMPKGAAPVRKDVTEAPAEVMPTENQDVAPFEDIAPVPLKSNEVLHVVEPNQDLPSIALMYGVRAEEVIKLNDLSSPDVKVGQALKIPPPVE